MKIKHQLCDFLSQELILICLNVHLIIEEIPQILMAIHITYNLI